MVESSVPKFKAVKDKLVDNLNCKFKEEIKKLLDKKQGEKILGSFEI
jgi:hypothetical protein